MSAHAKPRIYLLSPYLRTYAGHFFNQIQGFRHEALRLGLQPVPLASRHADQSVVSDLDANPVLICRGYGRIPFHNRENRDRSTLDEAADSFMASLDGVFDNDDHRDDLVFMDSATPPTILGLARSLARMGRERQPHVFILMQTMDIVASASKPIRERAVLYRYALEAAREHIDPSRFVLTASNQAMVEVCSRVTGWDVKLYPLPKRYEFDAADTSTPRNHEDLVVRVAGHSKLTKGIRLLPGIVQCVRWCGSDIRFDIQLSTTGPHDLVYRVTHSKLSGMDRVDVQAGALSREDYFSALSRSDVLLLPYRARDYVYRCSGPFSEAVALGKVTVVPADSWMADSMLGFRHY